MPDDPFAKIGSGKAGGPPTAPPEWRLLTPVPADAPQPPKEHHEFGIPTFVHRYCDGGGNLLGYVYRYEFLGTDLPKQFPSLTFRENAAGKRQWRWKSWDEPRPLYNLQALAARSDGPVLVCEGEKKSDAAAELTGFPVVASPGGSNAGSRANWQPLSGRDVVIWPDADAPGAKYAETVAKMLTIAGARSIRIVTPPEGVPKGWDAFDALEAGWSREQALALIAEARAAGEKKGAPDKSEKSGRRPRQRDVLMSVLEGVELWRSPNKQTFASIPVDGHIENYPIRGEQFDLWLGLRFYQVTGSAASGQFLADTRRVCEARAQLEGAIYTPAVRTAMHDGACWIDLGDDRWRAVRCGPHGWSVVEHPPVKFIRSQIMRELPEPEAGGHIETLRGHVNGDDNDYVLVVSWLIAALWGGATSYPILAVGGEQGSGKSTFARAIRSLVDPSHVPSIRLPKDDRDFFTQVQSGLVLSYDNVSKLTADLSDALCSLSTGAGSLVRKLHSDNDVNYFSGIRPLMLNGIPSLTERADLSERTITVQLQTIPEERRVAESDWWALWEADRPAILGALLDAVCSVVRNIGGVKLAAMPRMADFAKVMAAAEPGLGWEPGTFATAFRDNQRSAADDAFEANLVAVAVSRLMQRRERDHQSFIWEGSATDLLDALNNFATDEVKRSHAWPKSTSSLGGILVRVSPVLRGRGIDVVKHREGTQRTIRISKRQAD